MFHKNFVRFFVISLFFFLSIIFHTSSVFAQHVCDNFPVTTCTVPGALETWTIVDNNSSATSQVGEPAPWASPKSLWYAWTAPNTRVYVLDMRGTNPNNAFLFDGFFTVYSGGNTFPFLTQLWQQDDWLRTPCNLFLSTIRGTENIISPCIFLYANAGTKYYFQVDGFLGSTGAFNLNLKPLNEPTAANASITGRVTNENGRGISRTTVSLTDINGNIRTATTNPFGYYRFADIESGQNYTLVANRKGYQFENNPRVINVSENIEGENFVGSNPFLKRE